MQAKKILSLLLVLALSLAIFALPAAAETHDHDGCADCAEEIQPRVTLYNCPQCGQLVTYGGRVKHNGVLCDYYYCSQCPYYGYVPVK